MHDESGKGAVPLDLAHGRILSIPAIAVTLVALRFPRNRRQGALDQAPDAHAQSTPSYTVSPVHNIHYWLNMGSRLKDMGCHSICLKDMAGLLRPYVAFELVTRLKATCSIPIAIVVAAGVLLALVGD